MRVRSGDNVKVISGPDKGKVAKIVTIDRENGKVVVEGVNTVTKHVRPNKRNPQGGRLKIDKAIDMSNIMLVCPTCKQATRVGVRFLPDGTKERVCKKCSASIGVIGPNKANADKNA